MDNLHNSEDWSWDIKSIHETMNLHSNNKIVTFLKNSSKTIAIFGDTMFVPGYLYYWELSFDEQLYGTDTMVGVGTRHAETMQDGYCSLLGCNNQSWGYSYKGYLLHDGLKTEYNNNKGFTRGNVIGILLDTWKKTLKFYIDAEDLGVAFENINCSDGLFPMVSSTAAKCCVRLKYCVNTRSSLEMITLMKLTESSEGLFQISSVPGLIQMIFKKSCFLQRKLTEHSFCVQHFPNECICVIPYRSYPVF